MEKERRNTEYVWTKRSKQVTGGVCQGSARVKAWCYLWCVCFSLFPLHLDSRTKPALEDPLSPVISCFHLRTPPASVSSDAIPWLLLNQNLEVATIVVYDQLHDLGHRAVMVMSTESHLTFLPGCIVVQTVSHSYSEGRRHILFQSQI